MEKKGNKPFDFSEKFNLKKQKVENFPKPTSNPMFSNEYKISENTVNNTNLMTNMSYMPQNQPYDINMSNYNNMINFMMMNSNINYNPMMQNFNMNNISNNQTLNQNPNPNQIPNNNQYKFNNSQFPSINPFQYPFNK